MREIKFRAWIPDIERIYQVMNIDVDPQDGRQKRVLVWEHPCVKSAIIKNKVARFRLDPGVKIMQYTGLKDKNGKEIYEGDLIELHKNKNGCCQVVFENSYVGGWVLTEPKNKGSRLSLGARDPSEIEVIGNIYENPELIGDI